MKDHKKRKVLILNTGGTIGMRATDKGFQVESGFFEQQFNKLPEIDAPEMPEIEIGSFNPLVDSAQMTPEHWQKIADQITQRYDEFDSFVILHGTDTMAYTASALAFMLEGLSKTVILTGSQIPLCKTRNDARDNLITSLLIAGNHDIPEVCIFFGDSLFRGCRATKASVYDFDAFKSPNYFPLGEAGTQIRIFEDYILKREKTTLQTMNLKPQNLGTFRLFPGVNAKVLENLLKTPLKGLVLETYGVGTGPTDNRELLKVLSDACKEREIVIVSCSQCEHGTVSPRNYAAGTALEETGVVSGVDMTIEAATAKLHYLFNLNLTTEEVRAKMGEPIVGELTPTSVQ